MNVHASTAAPRKPAARFLRGCLFTILGLLALVVLVTTGLFIRRSIAGAEVRRQRSVQPQPLSGLRETSHLTILPLYDRIASAADFETGGGVSYLIKTDAATILMDLGNIAEQSAQLPSLHNMQALGVSWDSINAIVLTHPHPDHVGGTQAWINKSFSLGNFAGGLGGKPVFTPIPMSYSGETPTYSPEPTLVAADVATTGVIAFEDVFPVWLMEPVGHEQALLVDVAGRGLVVITGCGHPTLESLVRRAEGLLGQPVVGVVGGLHYQNAAGDVLRPHIDYLAERNPALVAISPHDSSEAAISAFAAAFPDAARAVRVGEAIDFP